MTLAEATELLRDARNALSHGCWNGSCCVVRARIDAALAEAEKPVEWTVTEEGPCVVMTEVHGHFVEVAPTVKQGLWAWRIEPVDKRVRAKGTAPTLDEAKDAAISAARGLS